MQRTHHSVAVYDTKPYDLLHLPAAAGSDLDLRFLNFRLNVDTAGTADGARAVCVFVNDVIDKACLESLASQGVELVTLRCTPRFQERCHPSHPYTRGLEDMTNASLQRGCQG